MRAKSRYLIGFVLLVAICVRGRASISAEPSLEAAIRPVDFTHDVLPILQARCFACHGDKRQESGLRLDRRDEAMRGGDGGVAIVGGKSSQSSLVARILGSDPDTRMPPKGELLSKDEVAKIRAWIDQGAPWLADSPADAKAEAMVEIGHWSLRPLARPPVPELVADKRHGNPIDAFILAKLAENRLQPSPEADRRILARRVYIDLTGLPPTPAELAEYMADASADPYERLVNRLLASPRYGERWARHWMDVAHFAETHGNDQDRPRPNAWPYRDYLIRSFNDDKPYARFVAEQVAGDVLYPEDAQATVALGFLAAGPWDESSLMCIVDDAVDKKLAQVLDRDDMVSNVMSTFTSTTVHCARCHNHKFDPISQADYYGLQAVFAGIDRVDRRFDADPAVRERRKWLTDKRHQAATGDGMKLLTEPTLSEELVAAGEEMRSAADMWKVVSPRAVSSASGSMGTTQSDGSVLFGGECPDKETYTITLETELDGITAVRLEALTDASLPSQGPGRAENGNLHLSEFKLSLSDAQTTLSDAQTALPIASAFADFDQSGWGVAAAIDGNPDTAWGINPQEGQAHTAVFLLQTPLRTGGPKQLTVELQQLHGRKHLIGRLRLSFTTIAKPTVAMPFPSSLMAILSMAPAQRSEGQQIELARGLMTRRLDRELAGLPAPQIVFAVSNDFQPHNNFKPAQMPRPVHLLRRGDVNQPLDEAVPGALSCVSPVESRFIVDPAAGEGGRRAALARWLVDPRNMLTWRSIVNRVWHYHFDRGLVDTPNDLGKMGGMPSHPELLDWLAVNFRDNGGSFKRLHRMIVTSTTYRQTSVIDPDRALVDADNRLLWRAPSRRLDAECIRDALLQASGKLDLTMGGPSVKQFIETKGIHVTPNIDYQNFNVDAAGNYRRSVYRFLFRTLPDPLMESLDCPDGAQLAPARSASLTALQALSLLDNRFVVRQSEHMAEQISDGATTMSERIRRLFQRALLRDPSADEARRWEEYADRHGLANACRMMFNTNEFVFVN